MRKRIFDIIQIGNRDDLPSRLFDYVLSLVIIVNIVVMFMETFDPFEHNLIVRRLELITFVIFIIEYVLRIWTADYLYPQVSKAKAIGKFLVSYDGIVEILTILPFFFLSGFIALRLLRVLRILHLFRLNTKMDSFHIIGEVILHRRNEILSSLALLFIVMFASSLCLYNVEHEAQPEVFQNAFSGLWCSVATILTVGYGDIYPVTLAGKIITGIAGIVGICITAILTGIISAGFIEKWNSEKEEEKTYYDIKEIGEIVATKDLIGRNISDISTSGNIQISLVLREGAYIIPVESLVIKENDILIGKFHKLCK